MRTSPTSKHDAPPENLFKSAQLFASDFDGTIALTFESSPRNINVNEAYIIAVESLFGLKALERYINDGGHRNRAPVEIVQFLMEVDNGKDLEEPTELLIQAKLNILIGEIGPQSDGTIWPQLVPGFLNTWQAIHQARDEGRVLDTAVISAGHTPFIEKTFGVWGIPSPDILVTDDTLRKLKPSRPLQEIVKPSPYLMDIVLKQWCQIYKLGDLATPTMGLASRVLYTGDDLARDGGLAANSGADFVYMDVDNPEHAWQKIAARLGVGPLAVRGMVVHGQSQ